MVNKVDWVKENMYNEIRRKYPDMDENFYIVCREIIDMFGYVYPVDVRETIKRIHKNWRK